MEYVSILPVKVWIDAPIGIKKLMRYVHGIDFPKML